MPHSTPRRGFAVGTGVGADVSCVGDVENLFGIVVADEIVVAGAAVDRVEAGAAVDVVVAALAANRIATGPAQQNIVAVAAEKLVVAVAAHEKIRLRSTVQRIV